MFTPTISIEQLPSGEKTGATLNGVELLIANVGGNIYAAQRHCTHSGEDLVAGHLEGSIIECPLHGAMFDLVDGRILSLPAVSPLKTFPAKIENGLIMIDLPEPESSPTSTQNPA